MQIEGIIKWVSPIQSGTSAATQKEWQKLDFVIEETGQEYPESVAITVFGDKVNEFNHKAGTRGTAYFNLAAKEYNGRYFLNANLWKFEPVANTAPPSAPPIKTPEAPTDDLPF